jgi:hypothetical protein
MIPDRSWTQFVKAHEGKELTMEQLKRRYSDERKRLAQQQQFINSGLFMKGL